MPQAIHPTMPSTRPAHCWRCTQHNTMRPLHAQHIRITCQAGPGHNLHACTRAPQPSQACPVPCNDMSDCISNCLLPTASSLQLLASTPPCLQLLTAAHSCSQHLPSLCICSCLLLADPRLLQLLLTAALCSFAVAAQGTFSLPLLPAPPAVLQHPQPLTAPSPPWVLPS